MVWPASHFQPSLRYLDASAAPKSIGKSLWNTGFSIVPNRVSRNARTAASTSGTRPIVVFSFAGVDAGCLSAEFSDCLCRLPKQRVDAISTPQPTRKVIFVVDMAILSSVGAAYNGDCASALNSAHWQSSTCEFFDARLAVNEIIMQRVVLLGASNLTLAFPLVLGYLRTGFAQPVRLFAAHGHGRSYGLTSRVLFRGLPGITKSSLWSQLDEDSHEVSQTTALLTDIGNDLLYGADVAQIIEWVEECLQQLQTREAQVVMTMLPLASVERLSAWRYNLTSALFFPGKGPKWHVMQQNIHELDTELRQLAKTYNAETVEPQAAWYGFDPIHIRRGYRRAAWKQILSRWSAFDATAAKHRGSASRAINVWRLRPSQRFLFGREHNHDQPVSADERLALHLY